MTAKSKKTVKEKPSVEEAAKPPVAKSKKAKAAPAPPPLPPPAETAPAPSGPKRMVLKTLKRAAATPPPPPTLHKVSALKTRRVVPKAPPPRPRPIPPPTPPAKPAEAKEAPPPPAPAAAPVVEPPPPAPAPKVVEKKKEPPKPEPTATYKLPTPPPPKAPRPPVVKPAAPAPAAPTGTAAAPAAAGAAEAAVAGPRTKIKIPEILTVKDLAERLSVNPIDVIKKLLSLGTLVTINQPIDTDTAILAADAFGAEAEVVPVVPEGEVAEEKEDPALLKPRPAIVTIMGHVDHGKTSLLDAIRKTRVAEKETGGITQHIGAYRVPTSKGDVVFLDTPGHEAFTAMRARGAQVTDIVVLVVAADDGVMPQTVEAIDHARAAGVTIVVAVNKIDLPNANPEKIRRELAQHQLAPEEWGGKTIFVDVSAKKGTNLDKLLEMLSLESELLELKANPNRAAMGTVVEARLDARRGVVATLLVQKGTLKIGDVVVAGASFGRVKALLDDSGNRLNEAGPSTPVEVLGLSVVPQAGDRFSVMIDERAARTLAERRQAAASEAVQSRRHVTLESLHDQVAEGKIRELKIILKADVQGSVQALRDALDRLSTGEIRLNVIHSGVGGIKEADVMLADASNAVIIGFNVRPDSKAEDVARQEKVDIKTYRIIYEAIADIRAAMEGLLEPETMEVKLGLAEVRQVFKMSKVGNVAGCFVLEGKIVRGAKARLVRDGAVVYEGAVDSLKRFKEDAREVEKGFECGLALANFQDIKPNDKIEVFTQETKARKLESPPV